MCVSVGCGEVESVLRWVCAVSECWGEYVPWVSVEVSACESCESVLKWMRALNSQWDTNVRLLGVKQTASPFNKQLANKRKYTDAYLVHACCAYLGFFLPSFLPAQFTHTHTHTRANPHWTNDELRRVRQASGPPWNNSLTVNTDAWIGWTVPSGGRKEGRKEATATWVSTRRASHAITTTTTLTHNSWFPEYSDFRRGCSPDRKFFSLSSASQYL